MIDSLSETNQHKVRQCYQGFHKGGRAGVVEAWFRVVSLCNWVAMHYFRKESSTQTLSRQDRSPVGGRVLSRSLRDGRPNPLNDDPVELEQLDIDVNRYESDRLKTKYEFRQGVREKRARAPVQSDLQLLDSEGREQHESRPYPAPDCSGVTCSISTSASKSPQGLQARLSTNRDP